jgi:hypothetical protein
VESLATGIDNALNQRVMREMPKWLGALIAMVMCVGLAFWSYHKSVSSLAAGMLGMPSVMLGISFLSLNTDHVFLDLNLSAGLGLLFVALLKVWSLIQKRHWFGDVAPDCQQASVWAWRANEPWTDQQLQDMVRALREHAFNCRILLLDITPAQSKLVRWKPFANYLALIGPKVELDAARQELAKIAVSLQAHTGNILTVPDQSEKPSLQISQLALQAWTQVSDGDAHQKTLENRK